jgi:hypothetical protein
LKTEAERWADSPPPVDDTPETEPTPAPVKKSAPPENPFL